MFLIFLILFVKSLLYEKSDIMNQNQKLDVLIEQEVKQSSLSDLHFQFIFAFPTIIMFFLNNRTMNSLMVLEVAKQETHIGVYIGQDFSLAIHNISIELTSLPQYQNKSYQYSIKADCEIKYLTRHFFEVGFSQSKQTITYYLNMSYETSGIYEIKIDFIVGSGNISLETCRYKNCSKQLNESKIFLQYIQSQCIQIEEYSISDVCQNIVEINTSGYSQYILSLTHSSTPQIQFIKENTVTEINLQNQEAFISLANLQKTNFLYSNSYIQGLFYCGDLRQPFKNNLILIQNYQCQKKYDMDQNLYLILHSKSLLLQYQNSVIQLAMNSKQRVSQQRDTYQFFSIETIFQEFIFDIFVYDYPLWVQIYFSNTTQFPNEQNNQFELIESNFKNFRLENHQKLQIGIKTKNQSLEYDLSIKEPISQYLNIQEEKTSNYCKTCQIQYKFQSTQNGFIFIHINFIDQQQYNPDSFKIFFISDGNIQQANSIIILSEQKYVRLTFRVKNGQIYSLLTKSEIQQKIKILLTDSKVLKLKQYSSLIEIPDYKEEVFLIDVREGKLFIFFQEIPEQLEIQNLYGSCNLSKISENYFQIKFHNNKKEDSVTYFNIKSSIPGSLIFKIFQEEHENINLIAQQLSKSQINYQFIENVLKVQGRLLNCSDFKCDQVKEQFQTIFSILQIRYENMTILEFKDPIPFRENFEQTLDVIQVGPFIKITSINLILEFFEEGYIFKFSFIIPLASFDFNLRRSERPQIFNDLITYLFIFLMMILGYLTITMIFRKKLYLFYRRQNNKSYQHPISYDQIQKREEDSEMIQEFE